MISPIPIRDHQPRVDTSLSVRAGAASLSADASRIGQLLGRHWSTPASEAEAEAICLRVAETALELRRLIVAERKARDGR